MFDVKSIVYGNKLNITTIIDGRILLVWEISHIDIDRVIMFIYY